jgi:hypothetical protein
MRASLCAAALLVVSSFSVLADESQTNSISLTVDGQTYQNVRWGRVTTETVTIFHSTGVATIPLWKLPEDLQKQFSYDPKAVAEKKRIQQEQLQKQAALKKASKVIMGNIVQIVPEGILASTYFFVSSGPGPSERMEGPMVLAVGCPKKEQRAEGEFLTFLGIRDGTWTYQDTRGASHTVQKWAYFSEVQTENGVLVY